jgi:hypothetical protein
MPYPTLPALAMPYDIDGTIAKVISATSGVIKTLSGAELAELNDTDYSYVTWGAGAYYFVVFFPELRDISAFFGVAWQNNGISGNGAIALAALQWSADTTNGLDGTWTNAVAAYPPAVTDLDSWRKSIKACSGISGASAIRFYISNNFSGLYALHLYGVKHSGETPDDIRFLDAENSDAEFSTSLDFADIPAGSSAFYHQIKLKNASPTKGANNVQLTVTDPLDDIRVGESSSGPWQTSLTITSIAANTASDMIWVKCETDAPPTPLGPNRASLAVTVGSWT